MSIEVLSPVSTAKAVELSRGKYKKQILPLTEINYGGKTKKFDLAYMSRIVDAWKRKAYPYVPVKLAPADNAHTQDVLRTGGRLVDLELSNTDGLIATLDLNDDGTKAVELSDGEVPVSVRMLENLVHSDGEEFDVALHHVLITDDPNIRNMGPWQKVDLTAENGKDGVTHTIDLSAERFGTEGTMTDTKPTVTLELTADQAETLQRVIAEQEDLKELGLTPEQFEAGTDDENTDDDDEDAEEGTDPVTTAATKPAPVALTRASTSEVELARAEASAARAETLELTKKFRASEVQREIDNWVGLGVAPALVELARPALLAPSVIELSGGKKTDAGAVVRGLLNEVVELAKNGEDVIELGILSGALMSDDTVQESARDAKLVALRQQFDR